MIKASWVQWPVAKRWGGFRDSKTHLVVQKQVMCIGGPVPPYGKPVGIPAEPCKRCLQILKSNPRLYEIM